MLEESPQTPITPVTPTEPVPPPEPARRSKKWMIILLLVLLLIGGGVWYMLSKNNNSTPSNSSQSSGSKTAKTTATVQGLQLDTHKNYGDKYANGVVPVGDGHYTTDTAKQGYIYSCNANFVPAGQAGAQTRGPWFIGTTQYDINKKTHVSGSVSWTPSMSNTVSGSTRVISTNDLPTHTTGVFPISSSDAAYGYDRNPNSIKAQELTYNLAAQPTYGTPNCMGGEVGVMLTGVALFDGFDAGGRDAGAWEVQDGCDGHPQNKGEYHYHSLSSCIKDTNVSTVIGFALDGFPITGPKVGTHNILTTSDLDECHGIVSEVTLDGKKVTTYHYVMTQDFPYSASCFRSKPTTAPGLKESDGQQTSGTTQTGQQQPGVAPPRR